MTRETVVGVQEADVLLQEQMSMADEMDETNNTNNNNLNNLNSNSNSYNNNNSNSTKCVAKYFSKWGGTGARNLVCYGLRLPNTHSFFSFLGSFLGMATVLLLTFHSGLEDTDYLFLVGSFGAGMCVCVCVCMCVCVCVCSIEFGCHKVTPSTSPSPLPSGAVLMYSAYDAPLAQPRNVIGGQFFSALVGVTMRNIFPSGEHKWLAGSLAVAVSIVLMECLGCVHPPGGASAMIAVTGSSRIHELGYFYAFFPCLVGSIIMVSIAIVVNNLSVDRTYPKYWL